MRPGAHRDVANIVAVARREFVVRATTRTYAISTLILVLAAAAVAFAPVAIGYLNRGSTRVAVYVGTGDLRGDPVATLDALLNPPSTDGVADAGSTKPAFSVDRSTGIEASLQQVRDGKLNALLDLERDPAGELAFTVYTKDRATSATSVISRQAATAIAIADRLGRLELPPSAVANLFAAPAVSVLSPDASGSKATPEATAADETRMLVVAGLELFLLLALVLYGNWVAQSVVEEKSSRMMEVILATASPFQLLAGKVIGVSGAALLQFFAMLAAAVTAVLVEDQLATSVLGEAGIGLPPGLTPGLLVTFSVFFVLGFLLYAVLFAAAASLVSRQEDVSQIVLPMTLLACMGYLAANYATLGYLDNGAPWLVALSWVPFLSPYMMLSRLSAGTAGPLEVALAAVLLAGTIVVAIWIAARIYAAGVLMYGQKPSIRGLWRALREPRAAAG
ncbi:MAG TPA: ABC transporter permease [Candidatus Limnocylindrales bacterium]